MADQRFEKLKELSVSLKGAVKKSLMGVELKGEYNSFPIEIAFYGLEDKGPSLEIRLVKNLPLKLEIAPKSFFTEFLTKLKLISTVISHDSLLDSKYIFRTKEKEAAVNYLQDPKKKEAIKALFQNGFSTILVDGKKITSTKIFCSLSDLNYGTIFPLIEQIYNLSVLS